MLVLRATSTGLPIRLCRRFMVLRNEIVVWAVCVGKDKACSACLSWLQATVIFVGGNGKLDWHAELLQSKLKPNVLPMTDAAETLLAKRW